MVLNQIGSASAQGAFLNSSRYAIALDSVQSKKTSFTPLLVGGVQVRMPQFSCLRTGRGLAGAAGLLPVQLERRNGVQLLARGRDPVQHRQLDRPRSLTGVSPDDEGPRDIARPFVR